MNKDRDAIHKQIKELNENATIAFNAGDFEMERKYDEQISILKQALDKMDLEESGLTSEQFERLQNMKPCAYLKLDPQSFTWVGHITLRSVDEYETSRTNSLIRLKLDGVSGQNGKRQQIELMFDNDDAYQITKAFADILKKKGVIGKKKE